MTTNSYIELRRKQHQEIDKFPLGAAFSEKQFTEMMEKWGLTADDTDKIYSLGFGAFIRKSDSDAFHEMAKRHERERQEAIASDKTGEGYIYEMFKCELADHEYGYTYELDDTLEALGLTIGEVRADERLRKGLNKALKPYYDYDYKV